ncbi:hypothetical protein B7494_g609 [Chlorociboria aeruginascens]|nr:hypothetical protein B7494_g609 [Chlorociboria aeruginascens]
MMESSLVDIIYNDPESLSDRELFRIPLSMLAKNIDRNLPSRTILAVYLQWLEVHRRHPSPLTLHWPNAIMHWAQSLQSKGFSRDWVESEVKRWKEAHEPFGSPDSRNPPMPSDIANAFSNETLKQPNKQGNKEPKTAKYRSSASRSSEKCRRPPEEEFSGLPPPSYVCNRCDKKGHYLQACPTNLDPSYDRAPDMNYVCPICKERGRHYKSLCSMNNDPYSIIVRRRERGIKTPKDCSFGILVNRYATESDSLEKHTSRLQSDKSSSPCENNKFSIASEVRNMQDSHTPSRTPKMDMGLGRKHPYDLGISSLSRGNSQSSDKANARRTKQRKMNSAEDGVVTPNTKFEEHQKTPENSSPTSESPVHTPEDVEKVSIDTLNLSAPRDETSRKVYSDFVDELIRSRGREMTEVVNPVRRRPTALEMWEADDIRRSQQMVVIARHRRSTPSTPATPVCPCSDRGSSNQESNEQYQILAPTLGSDDEMTEVDEPREDHAGRLTPYHLSSSPERYKTKAFTETNNQEVIRKELGRDQ